MTDNNSSVNNAASARGMSFLIVTEGVASARLGRSPGDRVGGITNEAWAAVCHALLFEGPEKTRVRKGGITMQSTPVAWKSSCHPLVLL